jgi:hypothetical protein
MRILIFFGGKNNEDFDILENKNNEDFDKSAINPLLFK